MKSFYVSQQEINNDKGSVLIGQLYDYSWWLNHKERSKCLDLPYTVISIVEDLKVKPEHRNIGVGKTLMKDCEEVAKQSGSQAILLNAHPMNDSLSKENLVKFYETCGFKILQDDGQSAIMLKEIK